MSKTKRLQEQKIKLNKLIKDLQTYAKNDVEVDFIFAIQDTKGKGFNEIYADLGTALYLNKSLDLDLTLFVAETMETEDR